MSILSDPFGNLRYRAANTRARLAQASRAPLRHQRRFWVNRWAKYAEERPWWTAAFIGAAAAVQSFITIPLAIYAGWRAAMVPVARFWPHNHAPYLPEFPKAILQPHEIRAIDPEYLRQLPASVQAFRRRQMQHANQSRRHGPMQSPAVQREGISRGAPRLPDRMQRSRRNQNTRQYPMSAARARQVGVDPNDFPSSSVEDLQPRYAPPLPSAAGSRARRTHTPESGPDGTPDRPNAGDVLQPDPLARIETDRDRGAYPGPSGNSNVLLPDR